MTHDHHHDAAIARHIARAASEPIDQTLGAAKHGVREGFAGAAVLVEQLAADPNLIKAMRRDPTATMLWIAARLREAKPS